MIKTFEYACTGKKQTTEAAYFTSMIHSADAPIPPFSAYSKPLQIIIYPFLVHTLTIGPNVATALGNSLPDPLTQSVLDKSRKNHQTLSSTEEIFSDLFSCLIAVASKLAGCKNLSLVANACNGPK